jgi:Elongation factor G, domain IV
MTDTILERDLLPNCSVAAVLERVGQGMEWRSFLDHALKDSLMTWSFDIGTDAAVVGHPTSLAPLDKHISTHARNSYKLTDAVRVSRQPLTVSGHASGKIKKQTSSVDQYAFITIRAEPNPKSHTIQLTIPRSVEIPHELHCPGLPEAILDGVCLASFGQDPARPIVGFQVTVVDGKWHPVDSYSGVFKRATCMAMSEILLEQRITQ